MWLKQRIWQHDLTHMALSCTCHWEVGKIMSGICRHKVTLGICPPFLFPIAITLDPPSNAQEWVALYRLPCARCLNSVFRLMYCFSKNTSLTESEISFVHYAYIMNPVLSLWLPLHYPQTQAVLLKSAVHQTLPSPSLLFHCTQLTDADPEHVKSTFRIEHGSHFTRRFGKLLLTD